MSTQSVSGSPRQDSRGAAETWQDHSESCFQEDPSSARLPLPHPQSVSFCFLQTDFLCYSVYTVLRS